MAKRKNITGRWRIISMELWSQDFVDAEVPGYILFSPDGQGEFHFGYVHCGINWEETEREGKPAAEFSFEGNDEMDPTSGHGWVMLKDEGIEGKLIFHGGDKSGFEAKAPRK